MRKNKLRQRWTAFLLCCALSLTFLPAPSLAAYNNPNHPMYWTQFWTKVSESGRSGTTFDGAKSMFESNAEKFYNNAMNGYTDSNGVAASGLSTVTDTTSHAQIIENIMNYAAVCWWADHNMLRDKNSNSINLFYNRTSNNLPLIWSTAQQNLATLYEEAKKKYSPIEVEIGTESGHYAGHALTWTGVSTAMNNTGEMVEPRSGQFEQIIMGFNKYYVQMNVLAIVGQELSDASSVDLSNAYNAPANISKAVIAQLNGSTSSGGGEGEATPTSPPTFNDTIVNTSTLLIGDTWLDTLAVSRGWDSWEGDLQDKRVNYVIPSTGDHPSLAIHYWDYATENIDHILLTTVNGIYNGTSEDSIINDSVDEVYIAFGRDALCLLGSASGFDEEEEGWDFFYNEMLGAGMGALIDKFQQIGKNDIRIRMCTVDDADVDDNTKRFINDFNRYLKEYAPTVTTAHVEVIDVNSGNASSGLTANSALTEEHSEDYWNSLAAKVTGSSGSGSGSSTKPTLSGSESTETGLTSLAINSLYVKYRDQIKPYFDVYSNVYNTVGALSTGNFEDTTLSDVEFIGYYSEFSNTAFQMEKLFMDLYTYGYLVNDSQGNGNSLAPSDDNYSTDNSAVEKAKSALDLISNCDIVDNEVYIPEGESPELNAVGYTALAAGAIYDPFVSIAGDELFLETLHYMLVDANDDSVDIIDRYIQEALNKRKPLYVTDGNKSAWAKESQLDDAPTGDYRYARLSDVLQHDENVTRVYTVVKGGMAPSTVDSSTWEYTRGKVKPSQSSTSASVEGEATDNGTTYETNSSGSPEGVGLAAGSSIVATAKQMSAPVMFTSGAKSGFVTGNWDGAASGYAASLGGLTTVTIHNAAQDAKSNDYIQHPEDYMLFMNGLGDIVLSDGTIVLPAIANPAIYNYDHIQYDVHATVSGWDVGGAILGIGGSVVACVVTGGVAIPVIIGIGAAGGAAGAVLGNAAGKLTSFVFDGNAPDELKTIYEQAKAYYPYTAAFMNHYPSAHINTEGKLAVTNSNDKGKYVLGIDSAGNNMARRITGFNTKTQVNLNYSGGGITAASIQGMSLNVTDDTQNSLGNIVPFYGGEDGTGWTKFNTAHKFEYYMVKDTAYSSSGQSYFPLNSDSADVMDSYLEVAGPLVTSARRFLTERNPSGAITKHHDTFNVERYVVDMCGQGMMGTMYSETLQKNYKVSYDEMVEDTGNRLLVFFTQLVESAVDNLGRIDGVLAIKNCYENSFFNLIVQFIQQFYLLIAVVLLIVVAVKFLRGHYNMIFVLFITAMCVCGFEVYANWMPTVVPSLYNFAVNDAIEQIVWNTTVVSAESYAETYKDSERKDTSTGALKPYTATMTLYKLTRDDMETLAGRLGTTYSAIKSGEVHYLDETAGVFVQGDAIKISVDKLLVNNTMRGLFQSQWEQLSSEFASSDEFITPITEEGDMVGNPYSIQLTNPYVSLEAYYMPYNEIERAFMINLNAFASIFRMERNQFSYGRDLYKDAFLFNCFTNSGIFTAPGEREVLRNNIKVGSIISGYTSEEDAITAFMSRVYGGGDHEGVFKVPEDWLNVSAVFRSPSENMKNSLWGKTMQNRQWYDDDWNIINPDAIADLIAYMNSQTKQFVIENLDQLNFCSDENAIKIVSLYATTTFTHYVSQLGEWLYPNYLNAADIELRDVLYGSMTTLKDRNFSYDGTAVNTVAHNLGIFGVLFLLLITVFATVFVFVMTYLVPILYALFGAILVFKLINDKEGVGLVQGYIKVTGVTCILYFIFSLSLRLVEIGGYAWYGYLGCAIVMALCCYFLFWVCLSVVQNVGELGNDVLGQNLLRGLDHITRGAVRKLTTNTLMARRGIRGYGGGGYGYGYGSPYQYGRGYGIDQRDYVRGSRSMFGLGGRRQRRDDYGYDSYSRGSSYDAGMYYREGRRGFGGFVDNATRIRSNMGQWASPRRNRSRRSADSTESNTTDRAS